MTPPHSLTPSHFLKSRHCAFLKIFFPIFPILFFTACVNPRLVWSEPEPNRTSRNRFCSVPRFAKNRLVPICREPNLYHKPKNRTKTDRLTECLGLHVDVAFATKHPKEGDIRLLPIEQLIRCLAKELLKEYAVGCIACGVDSFRP